MEILSFSVEGKFAHFRKFHGNNTAMSYSLPPRTTITGLLAALLGEPREAYHAEFQHDKLKIGIRVETEVKKSFHRLNFLKVVGKEDFSGQKGRIQTPFEVVTGNKLQEDMVRYRIYLAAGEPPETFERLKKALLSGTQHYHLSLGIAAFSAFINRVTLSTGTLRQANNEWVEIHSACNSEQVLEIDFPEEAYLKFSFVEEELLPADFIGGDKGREVYRMNRILFATRPMPLRVKLSGSYTELPLADGTTENIQFLEYAAVLAQQH